MNRDTALVVFSGGQDSTTCLFWAKREFKKVIGRLGHNSLTDTSMVMDQEKPEDGVPNTFVPGRNLFFLSIAAVYARERGINHLVTGVSQTDFSGYPDCRDAFIKSLNVTLNLAMDEQFVIHTPLMWIDKAETWALAESPVTGADTVLPASCAAKGWKNTWRTKTCTSKRNLFKPSEQ